VFDDVIEREIEAASCMIVLWSATSVSSRWVRTEAGEGAQRNILVPILIDDVEIPLAFRRIQAKSLVEWNGDETASAFGDLVDDIQAVAGPPRSAVERTVLFADICESTRLTEVVGDAVIRSHLSRLLDDLGEITERCGGRVVKTIGDEIMTVFLTSSDGLLASAEMQRHVNALPPLSGIPLRIKIGLHSGAVLIEQHDVFGDVVNVAARVVSLAAPDQILTTGDSIRETELLELPHRSLGEHRVRGREGALQLCELLWRDDTAALTRAAPRPKTLANAQLTCRVGTVAVVMNKARSEPITLGRGPECTLMVPSHSASRAHAKIVQRGGLFYLQDQSTNGTFFRPKGGEEVFVHRDQALLVGSGTIRLGEPVSGDDPLEIEYSAAFGDLQSEESR
jgi:adenylate cyclase